MPSLDALQRDFLSGLYDGQTSILDDIKSDDAIPREKRLQIYHNNAFLILTNILKNTFSAIVTLGGEDFFKYLTHEYIKKNPPASGNLNRYGETFPDFIATFPALKDHPYMADVARLEWLKEQAYLAPDAPSIDQRPHGQETITFHPSVQMISSPFPIDLIWSAAKGNGGVPDINQRGAHLFLFRKHSDIEVWSLEPAVYSFFKALYTKQTIENALTAAKQLDSNIKPEIHLDKLLHEKLMIDTIY